jgi:ATP-dependent Lhr-like helicase
VTDSPPLPQPFAGWFAGRGWSLRPHQAALMAEAAAGRHALLIAPTGAGKTLAGFLPSLMALTRRRRPAGRSAGLHTLYLSPLKALAVDIARNLETPIREMALPVRVETRTGDTSVHKRRRQKLDPPDILLTTPEQLALLIASREAEKLFADLDTVVLDELHALVASKRGDLLALGLARLRRLAPQARFVGLSATVSDPTELASWLAPANVAIVEAPPGARPEIGILTGPERVPWAGHLARHAVPAVLAAIAHAKLALVFVNTRAQAELLFQELWRANEANLAIALHHGSLDVGQRRRVEAAMAAGTLRAVVATSTLDLGIDWGDVDLVIHVGAPKGASRLAQRIGRANHRLDEPSKALLVPGNRFEVLECQAAIEANYLGSQDSPPLRPGGLDVLAQHILGMAVAGPFDADALYAEVTSARPYRDLDRPTFERVLGFVATGGSALAAYERYAKIRRNKDGRWRVANPAVAATYRLNVGTIVEMPLVRVRLVAKPGPTRYGGRVLGEMEEYFFETLTPNDTFLFGGEVLRFLAMRENEAIVMRARDEAPRIPSYAGGKFPLSTFLAAKVRALLAEPAAWARLPGEVADWLILQRRVSELPGIDDLLIETFPRGNRFYMALYPFEGRLAHQSLGMLLTRRLERAGARPIGFVATDYSLAVFAAADMGGLIAAGKLSLDKLFDEDMLGDDLEEWLAESALMKRMFRTAALIAGLVERRHVGAEKTGRQMTISTDLIYDVLMRHEPDHILIQAARADAATGLIDLERLGQMLRRIRHRIRHRRLNRVSPLAIPILLEIGREHVGGDTEAALIAESAEALYDEAMAALDDLDRQGGPA